MSDLDDEDILRWREHRAELQRHLAAGRIHGDAWNAIAAYILGELLQLVHPTCPMTLDEPLCS